MTLGQLFDFSCPAEAARVTAQPLLPLCWDAQEEMCFFKPAALAASLLILPVTVSATARPDLRITSLVDPPSALAPGAAFSTQALVLNDGKGQAGSSLTAFYLTQAPRSGKAGAIRLGRLITRRISGGHSSLRAMRFDVPTATKPGEYFLLACADDLGKVRESNERNNCVAGGFSLTVRPYQ